MGMCLGGRVWGSKVEDREKGEKFGVCYFLFRRLGSEGIVCNGECIYPVYDGEGNRKRLRKSSSASKSMETNSDMINGVEPARWRRLVEIWNGEEY